MSAKSGDLSVTALYTSATWAWGKLPNAELFEHRDAKRVFRVVNAVLGAARPFIGLSSPLRLALLHRHTLIDALLVESGHRRVLELAAGLSRRGVTFSADPEIDYVELDRPDMVATKRKLLARTELGREALLRPNLHLLADDVETASLEVLSPPKGEPLFVIAEGLMMYLDPDAQQRLARKVAARLTPFGGTFVFDFVPPREQPPPGRVGRGLGWAMKQFTAGQGFAPDERSRDEVAADLAACGFDHVEAIEPRQVAHARSLPHPDAPTQQLVFVAQVHPNPSRGTS